MIKLRFCDITAISNIHWLDTLKFLAIAIEVYTRKRIIFILDIIVGIDVKSHVFSTRRSFFDLLYLVKFWLRSFHKFPPWIIRATPCTVIPFIDVNGICAEAFDLCLDIMLQAVHGREHTDDAENSNGDTKQRKKSAELVLP